MVEAGEDVDRLRAPLADDPPCALQLGEVVRGGGEDLASRVGQVWSELVSEAIRILTHRKLLSRRPAAPGLRLQDNSGAATRAAIPQPRPPTRLRQPRFRFISIAIGAIESVGHLHRRSRR